MFKGRRDNFGELIYIILRKSVLNFRVLLVIFLVSAVSQVMSGHISAIPNRCKKSSVKVQNVTRNPI